MNRGGFSWKRALGVTRTKRRISLATGVPWTKSGRNAKVGRVVTGGCMGCMVSAIGMVTLVALVIVMLVMFI